MHNKKDYLINAFENLDADMLDVLLEDGRIYDGFSKEIFVSGYRKYFDIIKKNLDGIPPFKAYRGSTLYSTVAQPAYNFINEKGFWLLALAFEGEQNNIRDIKQVWHVESPEKIETDLFEPHIFFIDDKINYIETEELATLKAILSEAVSEIDAELSENGFLTCSFCEQWFYEYEEFYDLDAYFDNNIYSFQKTFIEYALSVDEVTYYGRSEKIAKQYFQTFISEPVISKEFLNNWLVNLYHDFDFGLKDFQLDFDFSQSVFTSGPLRYDFNKVQYTHSICAILQQYRSILPSPNNITQEREFADEVEGI